MMCNRAGVHTVVIATRDFDCAALTRSMRESLWGKPGLNGNLPVGVFVAEADLRSVRPRPKANSE